MNSENAVFCAINVPSDFILPDSLEYFSLTAPSNTQIWRDTCSQDECTAPMILTRLRRPLTVAEVTVSASPELEWDQGGLVIFSGSPVDSNMAQSMLRRRRGSSQFYVNESNCGKWAKVGLEYTDRILNVASAVATTSSGADWSLSPVYFPTSTTEDISPAFPNIRVKFERIGESLWIWYSIPQPTTFYADRTPESVSTQWRKLRQVMGFFNASEPKSGTWIGCYAARPVLYDPIDAWERPFASSGDSCGFLVEFEDLLIL